MPQHSRRILDEADGQTPRLNRRSCRSWRAKPFCHGCGIMAMPPFLAVRNHQLHHEILSQFLHIKVLKEEAPVAVRHDGYAIVSIFDQKAQGFVERSGSTMIARGDKRA
ncbi:hypothetical protein SB4_04290 [Sphingomonas sanguinis]|uniref:Uncharacterized protein n=1 Tax=Sphingomonas sanguinis TaxID=33051 RepID=A0A147J1G7_9SPHN|nr:hypothetical protein SB4_04290 [Sphingomonas sanguinis]